MPKIKVKAHTLLPNSWQHKRHYRTSKRQTAIKIRGAVITGALPNQQLLLP